MKKIDDVVMLKMIEEGKSQKEVAEYFGVSPAAVCKRLKKYPRLPESLEKLTAKEQNFALEVAAGKTQTQAALASFECGSMDSAKSLGGKLMKKPDIQTAVAEIMQVEGLTRTYRVRRLKQHVDNIDPNVSLKALDQTFKLDGAYINNHNINLIARDVRTVADFDRELLELNKEMGKIYRESYKENGDEKDLRLAEAYETLAEESNVIDAEIIKEN